MTFPEVMTELRSYSSKTIEHIFDNHGANGQSWGVKVQDLKKIQKKIGKDHALSLQLFESGVSDAQYLAGLIADEKKISKEELERWAERAGWAMISEYTVPWVAADSPYGWELGRKWIKSGDTRLQATGWATLASVVVTVPDEKLNIDEVRALLQQVKKEIQGAENRVRYTMNSFMIAAGSGVSAVTGEAKRIGEEIGKVKVDVGNTACKVPYAPDYIQKVVEKGTVGKKRKMARC